MDEETDKIMQHIDAERAQLGRNLDEIEYRVKSATDLKAHFDKNTGLILGAAVAGGFLLSMAFRESSRSSNSRRSESGSASESSVNAAASRTRPAARHLQRFSHTLDNIFEGLVGVVSDKLQSFVADAVPGFQAQYDAVNRQRGWSSGPDLDNHSEFSVVK